MESNCANGDEPETDTLPLKTGSAVVVSNDATGDEPDTDAEPENVGSAVVELNCATGGETSPTCVSTTQPNDVGRLRCPVSTSQPLAVDRLSAI